jgi:hypothetical protein
LLTDFCTYVTFSRKYEELLKWNTACTDCYR